tara:strand:- start:681 stop:980 length:300 start_codon:yes stop_codon:yes gene_type:complete
MPTFIGKEINGFFEGIIGYTYKEVDEILIPTEEYNNKLKEYQEYADSENQTIKEAYESLGFDNTWEEEKKQLMISCMINSKKLKTIHNINDGSFYYYLV